MAKGNDGNYFQHSVEIALATRLAELGDGQLHICVTHGMAPFEVCGHPPNGQSRKWLHRALGDSLNFEREAESIVVSAYRRVDASLDHYPNSVELVASIVGRDRLNGGVTEINPFKYSCLRSSWNGTAVNLMNESWRHHARRGGVLWCPADLSRPWLFSMDPMSYVDHGSEDDDKLYRSDAGSVASTLRGFVESGMPGAATLFVYAVRPKYRNRFLLGVSSRG
ncbi:MAG: hypothetical protein VB824_01530 [Dehalococcoidia bacterium]